MKIFGEIQKRIKEIMIILIFILYLGISKRKGFNVAISTTLYK
jgi:hypothetical protein